MTIKNFMNYLFRKIFSQEIEHIEFAAKDARFFAEQAAAFSIKADTAAHNAELAWQKIQEGEKS